MMGMPEAWIERSVTITPLAQHDPDAWEALFDDLPDYFWAGWRRRAFGTLSVSSASGVISVSGWPIWLSRRLALRLTVRRVVKAGLLADVSYVRFWAVGL